MRNFPNFIDAYIEYTQNQEASEKIHRWTALSVIGAALERKVWLPRGYYTLFPNLYVFIIGASGLVRKSSSTGIGVDLLRSLEKFTIMSERMTSATLILQLQRAHSKFAVEGESRDRNQSAVFCYASELSVFMQEVFGSIVELLTTFYDCQPNDDTKPWIYENKADGKIRIYGPCLNILGASTPTWLTRCIPVSEMEGGFSSRVVFVVENDPPRRFIAWPELTDKLRLMRPQLVHDLQRIHDLVGPMTVTKEARKWSTAWYETHQRALAKRIESRFSGYYGRKFDTLLKIAMILSVADNDSLVIDEGHAQKAAALLDELEQSMFSAFGNVGKNEYGDETYRVYEYIRSRESVTHSELLRAFHSDLEHKKLVEIAETLERMDMIRPALHPPNIIYRARDREARLN